MTDVCIPISTKLIMSGQPFSYEGISSERAEFIYTIHSKPDENLLLQATQEDSLKWTIKGAVLGLVPKGMSAVFYVVDIISPLILPDITLYQSERKNWHLGVGPGSSYKTEELQKLNQGAYSYFQNGEYFIAIRRMEDYEDEAGKAVFFVYVYKK